LLSISARAKNPEYRRTRASVALVGKEFVLTDATPDLEAQLEREAIRQVGRVFITHWHFDHVGGIAALAEPSSIAKWPLIDVYMPRQVTQHFDQELSYMKERVNVHGILPGDRLDLPDAGWEVVKTTHTDDSVGFIVESSKRFAYLVDGIVPPPKTVKRLKNLDLVILEATLDELEPKKGENWMNFSLQQAIKLWKRIGADQCILTHLSCHSWKNGKLVEGLSYTERIDFEERNPGLRFAYDGMRFRL